MNMVVVRASELAFRRLKGRSSADPFAGVGSTGMSMRVVHVAAGTDRNAHRHPHSPEAIYVVEGRGHLWVDGRPYAVAPGDCALVTTGVAHATIADRGEDITLVCFLPHPDLSSNIEELDVPIRVDRTETSDG